MRTTKGIAAAVLLGLSVLGCAGVGGLIFAAHLFSTFGDTIVFTGEKAEEHLGFIPALPEVIERPLLATGGFQDPLTWAAFSAEPEACWAVALAVSEAEREDFTDAPPGFSMMAPDAPDGPPTLWDIDQAGPLKIYRSDGPTEGVDVALDEAAGRIWLFWWTT